MLGLFRKLFGLQTKKVEKPGKTQPQAKEDVKQDVAAAAALQTPPASRVLPRQRTPGSAGSCVAEEHFSTPAVAFASPSDTQTACDRHEDVSFDITPQLDIAERFILKECDEGVQVSACSTMRVAGRAGLQAWVAGGMSPPM